MTLSLFPRLKKLRRMSPSFKAKRDFESPQLAPAPSPGNVLPYMIYHPVYDEEDGICREVEGPTHPAIDPERIARSNVIQVPIRDAIVLALLSKLQLISSDRSWLLNPLAFNGELGPHVDCLQRARAFKEDIKSNVIIPLRAHLDELLLSRLDYSYTDMEGCDKMDVIEAIIISTSVAKRACRGNLQETILIDDNANLLYFLCQLVEVLEQSQEIWELYCTYVYKVAVLGESCDFESPKVTHQPSLATRVDSRQKLPLPFAFDEQGQRVHQRRLSCLPACPVRLAEERRKGNAV